MPVAEGGQINKEGSPESRQISGVRDSAVPWRRVVFEFRARFRPSSVRCIFTLPFLKSTAIPRVFSFLFPIASPCISVSATKPYKQPISLFQLSTPNFTLQHTHLYTMHSTAIIASFLASLALSNAIKVESPNKDTVWQSNSPQTVEWTAVDTDPRNFSIQLVNQVSKFFADVSRQGWRQAGRRE